MPVFNDYKGVKGSRLEGVVYDTAVEVQKLKQQQTAGADIEILDLAVGEPTSLTYDVDNGISITKQGEVTATDNSKYNISVSDEIPIIPGDNINIDTSEDGKHIVISSIGGGGSEVAGVSSFGGQTGDIRVGSGLTMKDKTVSAQIKPTEVIIETTSDADASSGTLTDSQLATLQASTLNPIVKRNEYYYLNDNQHVTGTLGYTHVGYESGTWYTKNITITISTKGWVRTVDTIPDPINIDGKTGDIVLGANLHISESNVLSATNTVTSVNGAYGTITLAEGNNISLSKAGNTITISSTGGGSTTTDTGFDNVRKIEYVDTQTNYDADSGEYLNTSGTSTVYYKDNTSTTVPYVQTLGLMPGNNVTFTEELVGDAWKVKVNATGGSSRPTITLNTNDATSSTSHYGRTYYIWSSISPEVATAIAAGEYDVTIYDQTSGGGWYYCPLTGHTMSWIGQAVPITDTAPSDLAGWTFKAKESTTVVSFWRDNWSKNPTSTPALYMHNIILGGTNTASFTVYSGDSSVYTWETFINRFGGKTLRCGGDTLVSSKHYPLTKLQVPSVTTTGATANYITTTSTQSSTTLDASLYQDSVTQVM